ncbi:MAG: sugar ABC transporter permease [Clostridia bacterium]|nr:sugar ABC transporter permease [Clostridia bacterium]
MNTAINKNANAAPIKKKKPASLDRKKARAGWIFILPFLIGFVVVYLPMIIDSIRFSFCEIRILTGGGYALDFVGLNNYRDALFVDTGFTQALIGGLKQLCIDIPFIVFFSLFIAIILNQKILGRAAFRAIFFIPVILTTGLIGQIDANNAMLESMQSGGINNGLGEDADTTNQILNVMDVEKLFADMAVGQGLVEFVVAAVNNIFDIVNRCGVQMLIFLSGLQSISPAIYESCSIDGASGWETFWKVTLPMVSPMILVNTIYTVIDAFTASSNTVMAYINDVYNGVNGANGNVISSAMSWMYFLIVILIIAAVAGILSAFVFYQRRD